MKSANLFSARKSRPTVFLFALCILLFLNACDMILIDPGPDYNATEEWKKAQENWSNNFGQEANDKNDDSIIDASYPWYIQQAIEVYSAQWRESHARHDTVGMNTAHDKANIARSVGDSLVSRDTWGAQDFYDEWKDDVYKHAIVIHHTANNKSVKQIENDQINDKNDPKDGIAYHFIIAKDGLIYIGRPLEVNGGHTYGFNKGRIGIVLIGDFERPNLSGKVQTPSSEQLTSMRNLTNVLSDLYNIPNSSIVGHKDFASQTWVDENGKAWTGTVTDCPGKNLYSYIRQYWPI